METLDQAIVAAKSFRPMDTAQVSALLAKTQPLAPEGNTNATNPANTSMARKRSPSG